MAQLLAGEHLPRLLEEILHGRRFQPAERILHTVKAFSPAGRILHTVKAFGLLEESSTRERLSAWENPPHGSVEMLSDPAYNRHASPLFLPTLPNQKYRRNSAGDEVDPRQHEIVSMLNVTRGHDLGTLKRKQGAASLVGWI